MGIMNRMTPEFRVRSEMQGAIFDGGQNKLGTPFESLHSKQQQNTNTGYIATIKKKNHPSSSSGLAQKNRAAACPPFTKQRKRVTKYPAAGVAIPATSIYTYNIYIYISPPLQISASFSYGSFFLE